MGRAALTMPCASACTLSTLSSPLMNPDAHPPPSKAHLRARLRRVLGQLSREEIEQQSRAVVKRLHALPEIRDADVVHAFWPMAGEVDLRPLLNGLLDAGVTVALPVVSPNQAGHMSFRRYSGIQHLKPYRWGIMEPVGPEVMSPPEVILVPCLGMTTAGARLGHGGGYYDRFLAGAAGATTISPILAEQLVETVPLDRHDFPIDVVVSHNEVIRTGTRA